MESYFNFDIVYLTANIGLLICFIVSGYQISKGEKYLFYAVICTMLYTIILGLRFERGIDYNHYVELYTYGYDEGSQVFFVWINSFLKYLGVGKNSIFFFYSLIEISCALFFLKRYKKYGLYVIPFLMISTILFNEWLIRQALGFSFVFLCLNSLFEAYEHKANREIILPLTKAVLFFLIAYSIHSACGYELVLLIVIFVLSKKMIPLLYSILLLVFSAYFFSEFFDFSYVNSFFNIFVNDERMSHYVGNYDKWFTFDNDRINFERNGLVLFMEIIGCISLFYFGKKAINLFCDKRESFTLYNYFVVGTILLNAFRKVELIQRIASNLYIFWFFPLSIVLYHRKKLIATRHEQILFIFLIWFIYNYLKYLFFRGDMTKFIWDA